MNERYSMIGDIYFCPYCGNELIAQTAGWHCQYCCCTLDIHRNISTPGYWFNSNLEKEELEFFNNNLQEK